MTTTTRPGGPECRRKMGQHLDYIATAAMCRTIAARSTALHCIRSVTFRGPDGRPNSATQSLGESIGPSTERGST